MSSSLAAAHAELASRVGSDELLFLHPSAGAWVLERHPSAESVAVPESELPAAGNAEAPDPLAARFRTYGLPRVFAFPFRDQWWFFVGRRRDEPFQPEEIRIVADRLGALAPGLALDDALRERDQIRDRMDLILRYSTDAVIVVDAVNRIRFFNDTAAEIFGYTAAEVIGTDYDLLLPPELRGKGEAERLRRVLDETPAVRDEECLRWSKDGKPLPLRVTWAAVKAPQGTLVSRFSFLRDPRPIKKLREELVRAQSLAMIGELAASVAHEIRNPLASILAAVEMLRNEMHPADAQEETFRKILAQVRRLDDTVERLLVFAKPWEVDPRPYDLVPVVRAVVGTRGELRCPEACPVYGDPQLVEHVLANVTRNAVEAGGTVTVEVAPGEASVDVTVRDTGPGISPENQAKLFRPFFTTKTRGTGLGLATCQKMLQAHKGTIRIQSEPGKGTEVRIRIPREFR